MSSYRKEVKISVQRGTYIDEEGKEQPRYVDVPVSAKVFRYRRMSSAAISGSYKIINVRTAQIMHSNAFSPKYIFEGVWGKMEGDKRALDRESERLCSMDEPFTPSQQEMVLEAQKKLISELSSALKNYAR